MKSLIELIALVFLLQVNPASIRRRLILFIPLFLVLGVFYAMGPVYLFPTSSSIAINFSVSLSYHAFHTDSIP